MNLQLLKDYSDIFALLGKLERRDNATLVGTIEFSQNNLDKLNRLIAADLCSAGIDLYKDEVFKATKQLPEFKFEKTYAGYHIQIELVSEKIHDKFFICKDWDTLLSYPQYVLEPVSAVFISDENEIYSTDTPLLKFGRYQNISKVCQLIKQVSNDITTSQDYLIVFGQSLNISFQVDSSVLEYDLDPNPLEELLTADLHKEAKTALVRESLVSFLKQQDKKFRFNHLLTHFNAFSSQLLASYEQYVSNYSFDKVRREYQEKKTQYIVKINKVFDEVATKTFAIPAGVWLATSQIEMAQVNTLEFYKNITFIITVLVLGVIVCLNLLGQFSSLKALKSEYKPLFERLENEVGADKDDFENSKNELSNRYEVVWWKLAFSVSITIVLFIVVIVLVCKAAN
ncbi:hypothetical protein L0668_11815 [Paraglaciecola aquimarina]|uniref:Phage-related membrane protein n=1 Tax=Paraglaciecola algarum TaxID=3050085 RepID=A0ABS9D8T2_9ALTE|nr:hypothetical protein [Paraglaciecola sp. G1-23]MCF2948797.1 hypothetical protein [Paraglaciecola sp. G1-23]